MQAPTFDSPELDMRSAAQHGLWGLKCCCAQAELARLAKQHAERAAAMAKNVLADLVQAPAQEATGAAAGLSETDLMRTVKVGIHFTHDPMGGG